MTDRNFIFFWRFLKNLEEHTPDEYKLDNIVQMLDKYSEDPDEAFTSLVRRFNMYGKFKVEDWEEHENQYIKIEDELGIKIKRNIMEREKDGVEEKEKDKSGTNSKWNSWII